MSHHNRGHAGSNSPSTRGQTPILPTSFTNKGLDSAPVRDQRQKRKAVSSDEIRLCAYRKWENAGRPQGDGVQFWLEAERELEQVT